MFYIGIGIEKYIQLCDEILGFWQNKQEKAMEYQTSLYMTRFIDMTKTFDKIKVRVILSALQQANAPSKY